MALSPEEFAKLKAKLGGTTAPSTASATPPVAPAAPAQPVDTMNPVQRYGTNVVTNYMDAGKDIVDVVNKGADRLAQPTDYSMKDLAGRVKSVAKTGLNTAGAFAGALFSPLTNAVAPVLRATGADKPISAAVGAVTDTEPVKASIEFYKTLDPEVQKGLASMFNIATAVTGQKALSFGSTVAPGVIDTAKAVGSKVAQTASRVADSTMDVARQVPSTAKNLAVGVKDITKMTAGGASRIPSHIATNVAEKQAVQATIAKLPTNLAKRAVQDGVDLPDVKYLYSIPKSQVTPEMKQLVETAKKFAVTKTGTNPIEIVGKPIVAKIKQLTSEQGRVGQKLGEISKTLGVVTKQEVEPVVFKSLKGVRGLEGLTVDKNGLLNFKNTVLTTAETATDRKAIQSIFSQATKWGNGEAKHKLRQELFEVLGGKKKALVGMTGTQENAYNAIRQGLSDVLDAKNPAYKATNLEYAKIARPIQDIKKFMKSTGFDDDLQELSAGQLAQRLTSNSGSKVQITQILRNLDNATKGKGGVATSAENMQNLYNVLNKYYPIEGATTFQGRITAGVENAKGVTDFLTKAVGEVAGKSEAVRTKALEDALGEIFGQASATAKNQTMAATKASQGATAQSIKNSISPTIQPDITTLSPEVQRILKMRQ